MLVVSRRAAQEHPDVEVDLRLLESEATIVGRMVTIRSANRERLWRWIAHAILIVIYMFIGLWLGAYGVVVAANLGFLAHSNALSRNVSHVFAIRSDSFTSVALCDVILGLRLSHVDVGGGARDRLVPAQRAAAPLPRTGHGCRTAH